MAAAQRAPLGCVLVVFCFAIALLLGIPPGCKVGAAATAGSGRRLATVGDGWLAIPARAVAAAGLRLVGGLGRPCRVCRKPAVGSKAASSLLLWAGERTAGWQDHEAMSS